MAHPAGFRAAGGESRDRGKKRLCPQWRLAVVGGCLAASSCASTSVNSQPVQMQPPPVIAGSATAMSTDSHGRANSGSVPPNALPTPPSPQGAAVVRVGLSADGQRVDLHIGQRLDVTLGPSWTPPGLAVQDTGAMLQPLRVDSAQGYPANASAFASFTAIRRGATTITAHSDFACLHAAARCALPTRLFTLTVVVVPPTGQGAGPLPVPVPS
jgi:hypothetical protein